MNEELQQQIVQLVQAAMSGNQQASQQILQIMQAAQQGDQEAAQIAQMIQTVAKQMLQGQVQAAKFGAKLNYIRQLRGQCPEGTQMQYFKEGGRVCKRCVRPTYQPVPVDPIEAFKCGRKMKKAESGVKLKNQRRGADSSRTTRTWSDGTTSRREVDDAGTTYVGRRGETANTVFQPEKADSLRRADWRGNTAPNLKKRR